MPDLPTPFDPLADPHVTASYRVHKVPMTRLTRDAVEGLGRVAVVLKPNINIQTQTAFLRHLLLFSRNGDTDDADAEMFRHKPGKTTPATADVQHPHTGL